MDTICHLVVNLCNELKYFFLLITGNLVHLAFQFRRQSAKQELTPIIVQGIIPMCSAQYERHFNTTRIPGIETDTLMHLADSTYVVVMHKGRFFRLCCYNKGRLLNAAELQRQIQGILDDPSPVDEGKKTLFDTMI